METIDANSLETLARMIDAALRGPRFVLMVFPDTPEQKVWRDYVSNATPRDITAAAYSLIVKLSKDEHGIRFPFKPVAP